MKKALITGAAGFYGHHLLRYLLENTDWHLVALCRENFAGDINRIYELDEFVENKDRVTIVWHDLRSTLPNTVMKTIDAKDHVDYIFHVAASSHVNRSIEDPLSFVYDNVVGTANLLEYARKLKKLEKFFYFSTDEVFGPSISENYKFKAWDRYRAGNPYSATKAGGEELCVAYCNTYDLPIVISHCMNIIGERQHPEKYLPMIIRHLVKKEKVSVHTDEDGKIGKRHYIYVDEVSNAIKFLIEHGEVGEKYNIEGQEELDNLELAKYVAKKMDTKLNYELVPGSVARPGHDHDYAISNDAITKIGYKQKVDFWDSIDKTIEWYLENDKWLLLD